jgi:FdhE protein
MDMRIIHEATEAYKKDASPADEARLGFFEGLFEIQRERAEEAAESMEFDGLAAEEADAAYLAYEPLLGKAPASIDEVKFFGTCKQIADYMAENAGLEEDVASALRAVDWYKLVGSFDLELAGSNPPEFIEGALKDFDGLGIGSELPASVVMMVVAFALRAHIQPKAEKLFASVSKKTKDTHQHERPLACPVCGSPAVASHVAAANGIDGRDREQFCSMCGTVWPFERMRCGVCGTENATRLHYFHVEGDSSHRLQNCDECGQYQRMVFEEDLSIPLSMEVEDVVMAKLDAIALDPRFRAE